MTDRIADPWGPRTPYAPGEQWPDRVDQLLDDGVTEHDVDRWVPTASVLHSNGDGYEFAVKDGRIVGVRGDAGDRVNQVAWYTGILAASVALASVLFRRRTQ